MSELLAELLSSKVRAAVLGHLLPRPHLGFGLTDLSRRLDLPISSLQHECYKLVRLGLLRDERARGSRHYRPDGRSRLLPTLTAVVLAAIGSEAALAAAIEGVAGLEEAFVAGDWRWPLAATDIAPRLVLVGELSIEDVDGVLARAATVLAATAGRPVDVPSPIELAFFRPGDWRARLATGNRYAATLVADRVLPLPTGHPDSDRSAARM